MPLPATLLTGLRRQQLVDLARAYEIEIPAGATKQQMLPSLITAEQQGVFRQQAKHPYYLQKAHQTSDMPYIPLPENPELAVAAPVAEVVPAPATPAPPVARVQPTDPNAPRFTRTGRIESDYHRKCRLLRAKGLPREDTFGQTKAEIERLAAEHGIV